jgi:hypothetical protein
MKITQDNKNKNYKTLKISTHKTTKHSKYKYNTYYNAHTHITILMKLRQP